MYRFTKVRQDGAVGENEHVYQNDLFLKDNESQLKEIKRRETVIKNQSLVPFNEKVVAEQWEKMEKVEESLKQRVFNIKEKQ